MKYLLTIAVVGLSWACHPNVSQQSDVQGNFMVGKDYLWPNATADVCWEKNLPTQDWDRFAEIRQKVAETVTQQFALAGFTFKGWGQCGPGSRGIRVESWIPSMQIAPLGIVKSFGARLDGISKGLGFVVELDKEYKQKHCQNEEICIIGTALHEFGHGVGLLHEMNRPGSPCPEDQTGGWGGGADSFTLPQYDPDSIMNYCALRTGSKIGRQPELSFTDIAFVKELYMTKAVLPAEAACQADGFSWVAGGLGACCHTGSKTITVQKPYNQCTPDFDPNFDTEVPTADQPSQGIERYLVESKAFITAELPWQAKLGTFACWSGEVKGKEEGKGFQFELKQPADPAIQKFSCNNATFYNGAGVDSSTEAVIFSQPFEIPVNTEAKYHLRASEGIRAPVVQGKVQLTPGMAEKLAASGFQQPPPLGSQSQNQVSFQQIIKVANLAGDVEVVQSTLVCDIDGQPVTVISGANLNEYIQATKHNTIKALIYNFPLMKSEARCSKITLKFKRISNDKVLETTLNLRTPLVLSLAKPRETLELSMPSCVQKFIQ